MSGVPIPPWTGSPSLPVQGPHPSWSSVPIPPCPGSSSHADQGPHASLSGVPIPPWPESPSLLAQGPHPSWSRVPTHPQLWSPPSLALPGAAGTRARAAPGASAHRPLRCRFCLRPARARPRGAGLGCAARAPLCNLGQLERGDPAGLGSAARPAPGTLQFETFRPRSACNLLRPAALCCASKILGGGTDPACRALSPVCSTVPSPHATHSPEDPAVPPRWVPADSSAVSWEMAARQHPLTTPNRAIPGSGQPARAPALEQSLSSPGCRCGAAGTGQGDAADQHPSAFAASSLPGAGTEGG